MPIRVDDHWHYEGHAIAREKRVNRDALLIGRVRRWQVMEPRGLTREWFTVECWSNDTFQPTGEPQAAFEEALAFLVSVTAG
jgi:hypothetical protein